MEHLPEYHMVHFACHITLNLERSFDVAFLSRGEERTKLLDITRSGLATAKLAFLLVCHAVEWMDAQMPDEVLHLRVGVGSKWHGSRHARGRAGA